MFVNKLMSMSFNIYNIIFYMYTYIIIYLYRLEIGLCKYVSKFIRYQLLFVIY